MGEVEGRETDQSEDQGSGARDPWGKLEKIPRITNVTSDDLMKKFREDHLEKLKEASGLPEAPERDSQGASVNAYFLAARRNAYHLINGLKIGQAGI